MNDTLELYLADIDQRPLLTREEEVALATDIEIGRKAQAQLSKATSHSKCTCDLEQDVALGEAAREQLVNSNTRLVISIAKKYRNRGIPFIDLIQEGNMGLLTAIEKFDHTRGFRFSTHATWWIRQGITRALTNHSRIIRIPSHLHGEISTLYRAQQHLTHVNGDTPTASDLATETELPIERVRELLGYMRTTISLEQQLNHEDARELVDTIPDKAISPIESVEVKMLREEIDGLLEELEPREADVLTLHFGLSKDQEALSFRSIGQRYGVSRERIRQVEIAALRKIRGLKASDGLKCYA